MTCLYISINRSFKYIRSLRPTCWSVGRRIARLCLQLIRTQINSQTKKKGKSGKIQRCNCTNDKASRGFQKSNSLSSQQKKNTKTTTFQLKFCSNFAQSFHKPNTEPGLDQLSNPLYYWKPLIIPYNNISTKVVSSGDPPSSKKCAGTEPPSFVLAVLLLLVLKKSLSLSLTCFLLWFLF